MKMTDEAMTAIAKAFQPIEDNVKRYPYEMTMVFFTKNDPAFFGPMRYPNVSSIHFELSNVRTFILSLESQNEHYPLWVKYYKQHMKDLIAYKKEVKSGKYDSEFLAQNLKFKDDDYYTPLNLQSYKDVYVWHLTQMMRLLQRARVLYKMENKLTRENRHGK